MEPLGGRPDFLHGSLLLRRQGVRIPLRVNTAGHYILSAVDLRRTRRGVYRNVRMFRPRYLFWFINVRICLTGGLNLPYTRYGPYRFEAPRTLAACKAVTLGDAHDSNLTDPERIAMKLHVNWGHASSQQLKRVLADSEGDKMHLLTCLDGVLARREVCQASVKAPHDPAAGTSTVAMGSCRWIFCSWATHVLRILWLRTPSSPSSFRFVPRTTWSCGAPFAVHGLGFSALRGASSWMKVGAGRMNYGQTCAPNVESNRFFEGSVRAPGFSNAAMVWLVVFTID